MAVPAAELARDAMHENAPARSGPRTLSREALRRRPVTGREVPFRDGELIVSRTDPRGVITYINPYTVHKDSVCIRRDAVEGRRSKGGQRTEGGHVHPWVCPLRGMRHVS